MVKPKFCGSDQYIHKRSESQVLCVLSFPIHVAAKEVMTFGWNEHGMCATGNERNVPSPHTVDSLRGWEPVLVGTGAGHSFVVAKQLIAACAAERSV